ncbi:MAG: hypothetical protein KC912_18010 [Proteobacteria bacterium]|nr:hypothetical protein [Pseudomonadota bacterium]
MVELTGPESIVLGQPFTLQFTSPARVSGRLRLTSGTDLVPFVLVREGRDPESSTAHRVRGKSAEFRIEDWGEHEPGVELVARFEGAKLWMRVTAS